MCRCVVALIGYGFVFEVQGLGCCSCCCCGSHLRVVVWACGGVVVSLFCDVRRVRSC